MISIRLALLGLAGAVSVGGAIPPLLSEFKDHDPVVVMFAPAADDARFVQESNQLATLTKQSAYRSLIVAGVAGDTVIGLSDSAAALRQRFGVAPGAFRVVLLAKDGAVDLNQGAVAPTTRVAQAMNAVSGALAC